MLKRTETTAPTSTGNKNNGKPAEEERLKLKSELVIFYIGRMAFYKIDRIEDSIKACINHFKQINSQLVEDVFHEVIITLQEQGHIVKENGKTYIPLKRM